MKINKSSLSALALCAGAFSLIVVEAIIKAIPLCLLVIDGICMAAMIVVCAIEFVRSNMGRRNSRGKRGKRGKRGS